MHGKQQTDIVYATEFNYYDPPKKKKNVQTCRDIVMHWVTYLSLGPNIYK